MCVQTVRKWRHLNRSGRCSAGNRAASGRVEVGGLWLVSSSTGPPSACNAATDLLAPCSSDIFFVERSGMSRPSSAPPRRFRRCSRPLRRRSLRAPRAACRLASVMSPCRRGAHSSSAFHTACSPRSPCRRRGRRRTRTGPGWHAEFAGPSLFHLRRVLGQGFAEVDFLTRSARSGRNGGPPGTWWSHPRRGSSTRSASTRR